jgi:hypothetical protein
MTKKLFGLVLAVCLLAICLLAVKRTDTVTYHGVDAVNVVMFNETNKVGLFYADDGGQWATVYCDELFLDRVGEGLKVVCYAGDKVPQSPNGDNKNERPPVPPTSPTPRTFEKPPRDSDPRVPIVPTPPAQ